MMLHHIELCLDEIECEVEFHLSSSMSEPQRLELKTKIGDLRAFVGELASAHMVASLPGAEDMATIDTATVAIEAVAALEVNDTLVAETAEEIIAEADVSDEPAASAEAPSDDLTLIRGIDVATAAVLAATGVSTFSAVAGWRAADIRAVTSEGITARRIAQQCWIEQAAILAMGQLTDYARRLQRGEGAAVVTMPEPITLIEVQETVAASDDAFEQACGSGAIEINATKSSFLPPVFEALPPAAKPQPVAAPVIATAAADVHHAPELAKAACDAAEASAQAEVVTLTQPPVHAARSGWVGRMSLAASLILLMSVGILGIESKLPGAASFLHVVSAD